MNRLLLILNAILFAAVLFLFYKVFALDPVKQDATEQAVSDASKPNEKPEAPVQQVAAPPTGRIAYVNIDQLNERSLEVLDLIAESKRRRNMIESSLESLSMQYQQKVEDFQNSQKAGIAPESQLRAKAQEIEKIEKDAQSKQMQMEDLTMDINEKNNKFQKNVRDFLVRWNQGRYDYILSYSESVPTMLLGNSTFEITEEVITQLNDEYKQRKKRK